MPVLKLSAPFIPPNASDEAYNWKELYHQHRARVKNAQSVIRSHADAHPPSEPRTLNFLDLLEMMAQPLVAGNKRTFSKCPETTFHKSILAGPPTHAALKKASRKAKAKRSRRNRRVGKPKFLLGSAEEHEVEKPLNTAICQRTVQRFDHLCLPKELLVQLLRPRIYLDLEIEKVRPLGRVVIQLFTEACPAVVLEFVRTCIYMESLRFNVKRIMAPLWIEGEVSFDSSEGLMLPSVEHDMNVLDHGNGRGILSFPSHYLRGSKRCFVSFTISLKPLKVLNGRRVAFGVLTEGFWILDILQKYGSKTGKPLRKIKVCQCGIIV